MSFARRASDEYSEGAGVKPYVNVKADGVKKIKLASAGGSTSFNFSGYFSASKRGWQRRLFASGGSRGAVAGQPANEPGKARALLRMISDYF